MSDNMGKTVEETLLERIEKLEKSMTTCFGSECKVLQTQIDTLKTEAAANKVTIPDNTDKITACVGEQCKKITDSIPTAVSAAIGPVIAPLIGPAVRAALKERDAELEKEMEEEIKKEKVEFEKLKAEEASLEENAREAELARIKSRMGRKRIVEEDENDDTESEDEDEKEDEKEDPNVLRCPTCKAPVKIGDANCTNCDEALTYTE